MLNKINGTLAALVLLTTSAASGAVMGVLNTGSTGTVTVTLTSLTFNADPAAIGGVNPNADVATGTALIFNGCASGVLNSAGCLTTAEGITINPATLTAGTPPVANFLTFATHPNLVFSLTNYGAGSANTNCFGLAIGASCSIVPGAPLILTRTSFGTQASFSLFGTAKDGSGTLSSYVGQFNAPISNLTPGDLATLFCPGGVCNPNTTFSTSTSGNFFATAIPEPSTWAFMIGGLLMCAGVARRKSSKL